MAEMALRQHRNRAPIRKAHYVALVSMTACLVVATVAAQAQAKTSPLQIIGLDCSKTPPLHAFNTATCTFTTTVPAETSVSAGTDKKNTVPTPDLHYRTKHNITVPGLSPNTTYYVLVTATNKSGKSARVWTAFTTAAPGSSPATVTTRGNKLLLNGQPWLALVSSGYSCMSQQFVSANLAIGISTFQDPAGCQDPPTWSAYLQALLGDKAWVYETVAQDSQALQGLTSLVKWPAIQNSAQYNYMGGCSDYKPPARATMTGDMFNSIQTKTRNKPLIYSAIIVDQLRPNKDSCWTGAEQEALFWTVFAGGGSGLEYTTFRPWDTTATFAVNSTVAAAVAKAVSQAATLGPALLAGKAENIPANQKSQVKYGAWDYGGTTYVVGVNTNNTPSSGTFLVRGHTRATTAQVMWENRSVKIKSGDITEKFGPLAVHIYKVLRAKAS